MAARTCAAPDARTTWLFSKPRQVGPSVPLLWGNGWRGESPAIHVRFSRFRDTVQQGPAQLQETQIVQSCTVLDDFLPGFSLPVLRWANTHKEAVEAVEVIGHLIAIRRETAALSPPENTEDDAR